MPNQVRIGVGVSGAKGASSELDQLRDKFTKLQSQGAKGFAIGAGAAITTKALNLVGSAIDGVTGFLGDSIHAYQEQEVATSRLTASLKANIPAWDGNTAAMKEAEQAGIKLGFTDTETANALSLLVAATHDQTEALHVLSVAQDLARFKGISLSEAASALTSIEAGRARGLAQLGINVKDFATTEERLAAVEKVAGGQAQDYANTDLGRLEVMTAKVDNAQEKFGAGLSKLESIVLPAVADAVTGVADQLDSLTGQFDSSRSSSDKLDAAIDALKDTGFVNADALEAQRQKMHEVYAESQKAAPAVQGLNRWTSALAESAALAADSTQGLAHWAGKAGDDSSTAAPHVKNLDHWAGKLADDAAGAAESAYSTAGGINAINAAINKLMKHDTADTLEFILALQGKAGSGGIYNTSGIKQTSAQGRHASGGHASAGEISVVGEQGPELRIEDSGATYIPTAQTKDLLGRGGTTINATFNFHGVGSDVSRAKAMTFGQQVGDAMANVLRQQNARLPVASAG